MNTNQLKRFAKEARIKLLDQVGLKLEYVLSQDTAELRGKKKEIDELKQKIKEIGKEQVIEIVSYTWFNRIMALRFMDANGYAIPKVVTPLPDMTTPEILQNASSGNIEKDLSIDHIRINDLLDGRSASIDPRTEAYKMLLIASCNKWHSTMPFMFERINDYTELLLPDDLLSEFSIVTDIRNGMSDDDCKHEELIGWLYQFYISDKKDDVFEKLKKNVKITTENIPAATQLFTPHWIVRYMVENTLGKLWMTLKPDSKLRDFMPYYIESPEGNSPAPIPKDLSATTDQLPTKITFLDPCQGSGHVLVYAFDLFVRIYDEEGYNKNEIPELILKHNLFGIDIDERAAQLAAFALTMKARSFYSRFLSKPVQPNVIALENVSNETIQHSVELPVTIKGRNLINYSDLSLHLLTKADNFGSLIQIDPEEAELIKIDQGSIWQEQQEKLKLQSECLSRQYHCVVTNPPYMGGKGMNASIKDFVVENYSRSKSDLMACFMERCLAFNSKNGKTGMINQHSWMFLSSYENLRPHLIDTIQFESMLHLGPRTFPEIGGEVVQTTAFVFGNYFQMNKGKFIRLTDFDNAQEKDNKTIEAINNPNCGWIYEANQNNFEKIPGSPIGYWLSTELLKVFKNSTELIKISRPCQGMATTNNGLFVREWFEVSQNKSCYNSHSIKNSIETKKKWFPYNKGGQYRKWWGNQENLVNFENGGQTICDYIDNTPNVRVKSNGRVINRERYFLPCISWSKVSSGNMAMRFYPIGFTFDVAGCSIFGEEKFLLRLLAFTNSTLALKIFKVYSPTMNFEVGQVNNLPIHAILQNGDVILETKVLEIIEIYKSEWNELETSWSFNDFPIKSNTIKKISDGLEKFKVYKKGLFEKVFQLENEINNRILEIYETKPEVDDFISNEFISLSKRYYDPNLPYDYTNLLTDLISYSISCIFGRYSLDKPGLILANQGETLQDFIKQVSKPSFIPDEDNVIPVLEGEWFTDDIVGRFKTFLKSAFGEEHFEENFKFIEDTIGKDIRKYFVKDFYIDHIKRYKKRPIYWMFSSPKGYFKALIYMHRYQPDLCSKILNDYLRAFISKLEAKKQSETSLTLREDISVKEKTASQKEIVRLDVMLKDCREYEKTLENIALQKISIDLDDGVKVNYQKFKEVLVPIIGLEIE